LLQIINDIMRLTGCKPLPSDVKQGVCHNVCRIRD
jgi:hypothetical protein